ncbi:uncharacterized protein M8220_000959 [Acridotheres tristis]
MPEVGTRVFGNQILGMEQVEIGFKSSAPTAASSSRHKVMDFKRIPISSCLPKNSSSHPVLPPHPSPGAELCSLLLISFIHSLQQLFILHLFPLCWLLSLCHKVSTLFQNHPLTLRASNAAAETLFSSCSPSLISHLSTPSWAFPKILPPAAPIHRSDTFFFPRISASSAQNNQENFVLAPEYQTLPFLRGKEHRGRCRWRFGIAKLESEGVWRVWVCSSHLSGAVAQGCHSDLCRNSAAADSVAPGLPEVPFNHRLALIPGGQELGKPEQGREMSISKGTTLHFGNFLSGNSSEVGQGPSATPGTQGNLPPN